MSPSTPERYMELLERLILRLTRVENLSKEDFKIPIEAMPAWQKSMRSSVKHK
jgi:hypothetical protein